MPSSYADSIAPIIHIAVTVAPKKIIDIGPGWGKYGLMSREYLHPDWVEAIEVNEGQIWTQSFIYDLVRYGDVRQFSEDFWKRNAFDLALMIDVIEHIPKEDGRVLLGRLLAANTKVIVATPIEFFEQEPGDNPHEAHVSFWDAGDLADCGKILDDRSTIDATIVLLGQSE